ncbi:MAG: precorrin-6A/cobalt-precorrin-6A reductase [Synechococcaceae cyanobacterium]|nr:precorrin-6A/cobalt-precorrin-6A reductase [Synechococcaceae cyanobacterium]
MPRIEQPILKHRSPGRIWLLSGCGEGPPLARALLAAGWQLRVSVVSPEAARAYEQRAELELAIGAIGIDQPSVAEQLRLSRAAGTPFTWVIDASHPFASRISAELSQTCRRLEQPLLRLSRPLLPLGGVELLADLQELEGRCRPGERLLLAIGARQLALVRRCCPAASLHARVLPRPAALRTALAAGLAPERLVCLQPHADPQGPTPLEEALCRRWRIETLLLRRSGGPGEVQWRQLAERLGLRLLLLQRPRDSAPATPTFSYGALLEKLVPGHHGQTSATMASPHPQAPDERDSRPGAGSPAEPGG